MNTVLVPLAIDPHEDGSLGQRHYVRDTYVKKLLKHDLLPIMISHLTPADGLEKLFESCSGVLLLGGRDVNPALYGAEPHPKTECSPEEHDEWELSLIRKTLACRKPLFAICRGLQLVNVALGGTLHQHLGELSFETDHGGKGQGLPYHLLPECSHLIQVSPESRFHGFTEGGNVVVSSGHHQAVCDVAPDLIVTGRGPDGVVEMLEHKESDIYLAALQSHPEMMEGQFADELFSSFRAACYSKR